MYIYIYIYIYIYTLIHVVWMCYFVFSDNHWIQQDSCNRKAIQALVHKLVSCFLSYLSCFHFLIQYLTGPLQNPEKYCCCQQMNLSLPHGLHMHKMQEMVFQRLKFYTVRFSILNGMDKHSYVIKNGGVEFHCIYCINWPIFKTP